MTPIAVLGDMVRRAASGLLLFAALASAPALAGDRALIDYIGYSADGRYFAFEEFGVQDGSGFPYSVIHVVDLPADKWVAGAPFRALVDNEEAGVDEARTRALDLAKAKLDELQITVPASAIAINGDGDPRSDKGDELTFGDPGFGMDAVRDPRTLRLEVAARKPGQDCLIIENKVFGFTLSLDGAEVYADGETLPMSRGCAMGYKIHAVVRPAEWAAIDGGAV
ncbi:MAG TPA: DUF2259 domain-containing protein, partial [Devosia sp.]|nr:DUF2259 domain-containing protein [Devosia sp.]